MCIFLRSCKGSVIRDPAQDKQLSQFKVEFYRCTACSGKKWEKVYEPEVGPPEPDDKTLIPLRQCEVCNIMCHVLFPIEDGVGREPVWGCEDCYQSFGSPMTGAIRHIREMCSE